MDEKLFGELLDSVRDAGAYQAEKRRFTDSVGQARTYALISKRLLSTLDI